MKFSVLMSLYTQEQPEFLHQSLASLQAQTQLADEIIMVFDGAISTELETVVQNFQTVLPIHILRLPENVGLGNALNFGIKHCSHEWVFRMDTDDVALPTRFAEQCAFIAQNPHISLFGGQIVEFTTLPEHAHATRITPLTLPEIISYAKKRNPFNHMTIAYQKSVVQKAGGYQHHQFMEDYNLWLRMLANGVQAVNLPSILVQARTGTAMLARRRGVAYVRSEWKLAYLKWQLNFQAALPALLWFIVRSVPRILPDWGIKWIYTQLRR